MSSRRSGSLASLREGNRRMVIEALRERGVASRAELARVTELSRSTISTIVGDLIGDRPGRRAQRPARGRVPRGPARGDGRSRPVRGLALAIDFGHRHLRVAVSDLSHTVLAERWCELDVDQSASEGLAEGRPSSSRRSWSRRRRSRQRDRRVMGLPAPINRVSGTVQDRRSCPAGSGSTPPARRARASTFPWPSRTTPTSARSPS